MQTQTVSKTTAEAAAAEPQQRKRKTQTDWQVFEDAKFVPVRVRCDGYMGYHPAELSCHSNIRVTGPDVLRHMHGGLDGGEGWFKVRFRLSDGSGSPVWRELEEAGIEIHELYCPHCRQDVPVEARQILGHLRPHPGANRVNLEPQTLCMTLGVGMPKIQTSNDLYQ